MTDSKYLRRVARELFNDALVAVDPRIALRDAVVCDGGRLRVHDWFVEINSRPVYVVAIGKAAPAMTMRLEEVLGEKVEAGVISGPALPALAGFKRHWRTFAGGHPLPNEQSLAAAKAAIDLVTEAETKHAIVIYLISGGGSAMFEWPRDQMVTLADLKEANRKLVTCGATITEMNVVRQAFSAVKAGGLAKLAPNANQISLIVSDTNPGDEASVASGPSIVSSSKSPKASTIVERYGLSQSLPQTILQSIEAYESSQSTNDDQNLSELRNSNYYVLLDNDTAVNAVAKRARELGFVTEVAADIREQSIAEGCRLLMIRLERLQKQLAPGQIACLVSGGEFVCPVRGSGVGGRNLETVLRCVGELSKGRDKSERVVFSAGTDGIDGNSPAAGAVADEFSFSRARSAGLDPEEFLERSDAYSFFKFLEDDITVGLTGTNVRDIRILLAGN